MADSGSGPRFKPETVGAVFQRNWSDKTKASNDALKLSAEYMRCFVLEAAHRAAETAKAEGVTRVEPHHLEKVLPQLLLDF